MKEAKSGEARTGHIIPDTSVIALNGCRHLVALEPPTGCQAVKGALEGDIPVLRRVDQPSHVDVVEVVGWERWSTGG